MPSNPPTHRRGTVRLGHFCSVSDSYIWEDGSQLIHHMWMISHKEHGEQRPLLIPLTRLSLSLTGTSHHLYTSVALEASSGFSERSVLSARTQFQWLNHCHVYQSPGVRAVSVLGSHQIR